MNEPIYGWPIHNDYYECLKCGHRDDPEKFDEELFKVDNYHFCTCPSCGQQYKSV